MPEAFDRGASTVKKMEAGVAVCLVLMRVLYAAPGGAAGAEERAIRIGVLAKEGAQRCIEQWQPTADCLTSQVPGCRFVVEPLQCPGGCPSEDRQGIKND